SEQWWWLPRAAEECKMAGAPARARHAAGVSGLPMLAARRGGGRWRPGSVLGPGFQQGVLPGRIRPDSASPAMKPGAAVADRPERWVRDRQNSSSADEPGPTPLTLPL